MELRVLGPLQVLDGGEHVEVRGDRVRALLVMLLQRPDEVVSADGLVEAMWGDAPPPTARAALRMHASRLRQRLGPAAQTGVDVVSQASGYRLAVDADAVDHVRFERLLGEARRGVDRGELAAAAALLQQALGLWRGPAFADVDIPALAAMARHLESRQLEARDLLFATRLALGESSELIADLEAAAAEHPEHERLTAHLMAALYRSGRQSDALAAFQRLRTWLAEELGLSPSAELTDLEAGILRQDPSLVADPSASRAAAPPPPRDSAALPPSIAGFRRGPFVGRDAEVDRIAAGAIPAGGADAGMLQCVVGPAGIGKSRVVAEVAAMGAADGITVVHGWAQPGAPLPFSAFRAAIAPLAADGADGPAKALLDLLDAEGDGLDRRRVRLLGLLERLADGLTDCGRRRALLVLDDLHWADSLSLASLHHLARRATPGLGLLVAARTSDGAPAWGQFLAELSTVPGARVHEVGGLDVDAVIELVAAHDAAGSRREHRRLAERLVEATRGNPFYVTATIDGFLDERRDGAPTFSLDAPRMPSAVFAAVDRRLRGLPPRTRTLLGTAAVVGPTFSVELLAEVCGEEPGPVEAGLLAAVEDGIVSERTDDPSQLRFDHELLRRAVLDELGAPIRRSHHLAVAEVLRSQEADPITVAYHLYRAMPLAERGEVVAALRSAAVRALEATAWDEACTIASAALETAAGGTDDPALRIDLLVLLGRARMGAAGREVAMGTFEEALDLALDTGRTEKVDAILLAATQFYTAVTPGDPVLALLDRVLRDGDRAALGASALAEVAIQRSAVVGATDELTAMLGQVRSSLERPDESVDLLRAEMYFQAGRPDVAAGLAAATRVQAAAGDPDGDLRFQWVDAQFFKIGFELLAGDVGAATAGVPAFERGAQRLRLPVFLWLVPVVRSDLALQAGRFEEAAAEVTRAVEYGAEHQVPDAVASHGFHLLVTALLRGGVEAHLPVVEQAVELLPTVIPYRAALAVLRAETGETAAARELLASTLDLLERAPPSLTTTLSLGLAAWAGVAVGDVDLAERLVDLGEPWSGTVPRTAMVGASLGPFDRLLGRLECLLGRADDGEAHLRRAVALSDRMGARPWSAWSRYDLATVTPDGAEAAELLAAAGALAEELSMEPLCGLIAAASAPAS